MRPALALAAALLLCCGGSDDAVNVPDSLDIKLPDTSASTDVGGDGAAYLGAPDVPPSEVVSADIAPGTCTIDFDCDDDLPCTTNNCDFGKCANAQEDGTCIADGACWGAGDHPPGDPCRACDPEKDPKGWTPLADGQPCDDLEACTPAGVCEAGNCKQDDADPACKKPNVSGPILAVQPGVGHVMGMDVGPDGRVAVASSGPAKDALYAFDASVTGVLAAELTTEYVKPPLLFFQHAGAELWGRYPHAGDPHAATHVMFEPPTSGKPLDLPDAATLSDLIALDDAHVALLTNGHVYVAEAEAVTLDAAVLAFEFTSTHEAFAIFPGGATAVVARTTDIGTSVQTYDTKTWLPVGAEGAIVGPNLESPEVHGIALVGSQAYLVATDAGLYFYVLGPNTAKGPKPWGSGFAAFGDASLCARAGPHAVFHNAGDSKLIWVDMDDSGKAAKPAAVAELGAEITACAQGSERVFAATTAGFLFALKAAP